MKTITINNRRYRLTLNPHYNRVEVNGPGLLIGVYLPAGVTLESPDLRQQVAATIDRDREHAQRASDAVRQQVREGTAGLGPAEDR